MYVIEDEIHAEWCGEFSTRDEAIAELERRSRIAWDQRPNVCPCMSWKTCGREYSLVEFDESSSPWREKSRAPALVVSADRTEKLKALEPSSVTREDA